MPHIFLEVGVIGLTPSDGFMFDITRPAQHCKLCGDSFQPWLARTDEFLSDGEVQLAVQIELDEWRRRHNNKHTEAEHKALAESGKMMTPEAALRLIPLGIYPLDDLMFDEEVMQAGLEAPRAPINDVPDSL